MLTPGPEPHKQGAPHSSPSKPGLATAQTGGLHLQMERASGEVRQCACLTRSQAITLSALK